MQQKPIYRQLPALLTSAVNTTVSISLLLPSQTEKEIYKRWTDALAGYTKKLRNRYYLNWHGFHFNPISYKFYILSGKKKYMYLDNYKETCHFPNQGISFALKMEARSSLKYLYLSNPISRRHNSEDRAYQTHHPELMKCLKQSKEQSTRCIHKKPPLHRTTPCWLSLTAC